MDELAKDIDDFRQRKATHEAEARQAAALRLSCGIDLHAVVEAVGQQRERMKQRIERQLRRERLRGLRRHWSYDLNRHIALKQVLDRLI